MLTSSWEADISPPKNKPHWEHSTMCRRQRASEKHRIDMPIAMHSACHRKGEAREAMRSIKPRPRNRLCRAAGWRPPNAACKAAAQRLGAYSTQVLS